MFGLNLSLSGLAVALLVSVVIAIGGSVVLARWASNTLLIRLGLVACVIALVFAPTLRTVNEALGLELFIRLLFPALALITAAVVSSTARFMQSRRWEMVPGLVLSVAAAGLMLINMATPWLWPYQAY